MEKTDSNFSLESKKNSVSVSVLSFIQRIIQFFTPSTWEIIYSGIVVIALMLLVAIGTGEIIGWLMNLMAPPH